MVIHPCGKKYILRIVLLIAIINFLAWYYIPITFINVIISILSFFLFCGVAQFFRYPNRPLIPVKNQIISPADGTICAISNYKEEEILKKDTLRVSIFMSPLNVHINWIPIGGKVTFLKHKKGKFNAAFKDKASEENERFSTVTELEDGRQILTNQIAGALARRVLNYLKIGQQVETGEEMGFIRLGSRVDMYLPTNTQISVKIGDSVRGRETVIGTIVESGKND